MREKIGSYPYEIKKENGFTVIRFFPKSSTAQNPDSIVFVLRLNKEDSTKQYCQGSEQ